MGVDADDAVRVEGDLELAGRPRDVAAEEEFAVAAEEDDLAVLHVAPKCRLVASETVYPIGIVRGQTT